MTQTWTGYLLSLAAYVGAVWGQTAQAFDAPQFSVSRDISYRTSTIEKCRLDLAIPTGASAPCPAVVVIHGGGWIEGDKSSFSSDDRGTPGNIVDFAKLGFVAATINYRLADEAIYPAALDDCREAIRYLRANAEQFHIDATRIGVYGNSAGGHLALLLGMAAEPPAVVSSGTPRISCAVQAVASDSGPIDLARQHQQNQLRVVIEKFLGGPPQEARLTRYHEASPSQHISSHIPPLLLIYGVNDEQVDIHTADDFVAALARGGHKDVTYLRLGGVGHCPHSLRHIPSARSAVDEFFIRTLRPADAQR